MDKKLRNSTLTLPTFSWGIRVVDRVNLWVSINAHRLFTLVSMPSMLQFPALPMSVPLFPEGPCQAVLWPLNPRKIFNHIRISDLGLCGHVFPFNRLRRKIMIDTSSSPHPFSASAGWDLSFILVGVRQTLPQYKTAKKPQSCTPHATSEAHNQITVRKIRFVLDRP